MLLERSEKQLSLSYFSQSQRNLLKKEKKCRERIKKKVACVQFLSLDPDYFSKRKQKQLVNKKSKNSSK